MQFHYHPAASRGYADHGWLRTHHTFSFANYRNPERMGFGVLRVLNDDEVAPGYGFGRHPHDNMEIVSLPLEGDLEHRDSMGNVAVIRAGDVQVMSAGTGVVHSEKNHHRDQPVKFLQIWVQPRERNVEPRYDQITLDPARAADTLHPVIGPAPAAGRVWINQDAYFSLGHFTAGGSTTYRWRDVAHGVYLFVLAGSFTVGDRELATRDGLGVTGATEIEVTAREAGSRLLVMEVPMN